MAIAIKYDSGLQQVTKKFVCNYLCMSNNLIQVSFKYFDISRKKTCTSELYWSHFRFCQIFGMDILET